MRAIAAAEAELDADAPDTAYKLLATAEMVNSTTLGVPGWSGFVRASRSPSHAAATLHRCCSTRPGASYPRRRAGA
jgi:hypothetical protein